MRALMLLLALALALAACAHAGKPTTAPMPSASADPDDEAIVKAIIDDFFAHGPNLSKHAGAVLAVDPTTALPYSSTPEQTRETCTDLSRFREPMRDARGPLVLSQTLTPSSQWRFATRKESQADMLGLGRDVMNVIRLTTPVYSADHASALVEVDFVWVHGGRRTYMLVRQNGGWQLGCADTLWFM